MGWIGVEWIGVAMIQGLLCGDVRHWIGVGMLAGDVRGDWTGLH